MKKFLFQWITVMFFALLLVCSGNCDVAGYAQTTVSSGSVWLLNGQVTYDKNGMGVGGVTVAFVYDDGGQVSTTTDANGYYRLQPALGHPGTVTITGYTWRKVTDRFSARGSDGEETWNYTLHDR